MIEFTRASKATYIDKNGVLREAQINEPRFEKDGLLVEGSSTNLCSLSDRFLVQIAGQAELNVLSDSIGKYTEISVLTTNWTVQQLISVKPNKTYTASFWVKFKAGLTLQCGLDFNSNSGATPKLMRVLGTGDWVRVSATGISGSTTNTAYPKIMFFDDAVGEKVYIRFCQLEEMPFATSYIPTNGAPVTRAADLLNVSQDIIGAEPHDITTSITFKNLGDIGHDQQLYRLGGGINMVGVTLGRKNIFSEFGSYGAYSLPNAPSSDGVVAVSYEAGDSDGTSKFYHRGNLVSLKKAAKQPIDYTAKLCIGHLNGVSEKHFFGHLTDFRYWGKTLSENQIKEI